MGFVQAHPEMIQPLDILEYAYKQCRKIIGSSTAVVLSVDPDTRVLRAANLGDSGFRVFRRKREVDSAQSASGSESQNKSDDDLQNWEVVAQSREQFHMFNCPFQIGTKSRDRPSDAQLLSAQLERGDVIVTVSSCCGVFATAPIKFNQVQLRHRVLACAGN